MGCISPALSASRSSRAARDPLDRGVSARRRHSLSCAANASGAPLARRKHRCIPGAHRPWTRGFCGDSRRMLKAETRWRSSTVSSSSHEIDATTGYRFVVTRWRSEVNSNCRYRFLNFQTTTSCYNLRRWDLDWDDLRQLLSRAVAIDRDRITADCTRGFGFLAELTDEERVLADDQHQRERALADKLRAGL